MRKEAVERKNEILDAADELFGKKGFDGTSTNDILEKVGIARGTLYHHFKSKEEIMDALINRYSDRLLGAARGVAADKTVPLLDRILRVVISMNVNGGNSEEIMEHIHKPQNALMHQKIQKMMIRGLTPILAEIISEGVEQGAFHTPYPYETMEMVVTYANIIFDDDMVDMTEEERGMRILAFIHNVERMLDVETGSFMTVAQMFGGNK